MVRRLAVLLAVVALVATACGDDKKDEAKTTTTTAASTDGPQTFQIGVDAKSDGFATSWIHYFPAEMKARPGDTIEFKGTFTGEPHSVATGTLINEALDAFSKLPEGDAPPPPEIQAVLDKVPFIFNDNGTGPDDAFIQAAAQPCFLATDDPPTKDACPAAAQKAPTEFTGKERFLSSGFLPDEATLKLKLADDIAPGTYTFTCLVHGPEMTEKVTVVAPGTTVPSPDDVLASAQAELDGFVAKVKDKAAEVRAITTPDAKGGFNPDESLDIPSAGVNVYPTNIAAKVGQKVTWTLDGFHTVAFNATEDARPWLTFADSGVLTVNKKAALPTNSPAIPDPPKAAEGSDEGPPPQLKVDAGSFDGQQFRNSGFPFANGQLVYSVSFSKPGTYKYMCLVHPDMEGTVTVT